jgi:hypothetical protein
MTDTMTHEEFQALGQSVYLRPTTHCSYAGELVAELLALTPGVKVYGSDDWIASHYRNVCNALRKLGY